MLIGKKLSFNENKQSTIPKDYMQIDFVDTNMSENGSDGNPIGAYVKTNITNLVASKVQIYAKAYLKDINYLGEWNFLIGAETTDNETGNIKIRLYGRSDNGGYICTHISDSLQIKIMPNTILNIEYNPQYFKVNDNIVNITTTPSSIVNTNNLFIGGAQLVLSWGSGRLRVWPGLIGDIKIIQDQMTLGEFYPCIRKSDNKVGFYDLITNQFMPSSNPRTEFSVGVI